MGTPRSKAPAKVQPNTISVFDIVETVEAPPSDFTNITAMLEWVHSQTTGLDILAKRTVEVTVKVKGNMGLALINSAIAANKANNKANPENGKWTPNTVFTALGITDKAKVLELTGWAWDSFGEVIDFGRAILNIGGISGPEGLAAVASAQVATMTDKSGKALAWNAKSARQALNKLADPSAGSNRQKAANEKQAAITRTFSSGKVAPTLTDVSATTAGAFGAFDAIIGEVNGWADLVKLSEEQLTTVQRVVSMALSHVKASKVTDPDTGKVTS